MTFLNFVNSVWGSKKNPEKSVLSLHSVGPRDDARQRMPLPAELPYQPGEGSIRLCLD